MPMLPNRIHGFNLLVDEQNRRMTQMKLGIRHGADRIQRLHDAGFHIEALMINGQLVEQACKSVVRAFLLKRSGFDAAGLPDPYPKISDGSVEFRPLGDAIARLEEYTGQTRLVEMLREFNKRRADFIHHAFDGSRDPKNLDQEALGVINENEFREMVLSLAVLEEAAKKELKKLY